MDTEFSRADAIAGDLAGRELAVAAGKSSRATARSAGRDQLLPAARRRDGVKVFSSQAGRRQPLASQHRPHP
jgi:hypothetical protein